MMYSDKLTNINTRTHGNEYRLVLDRTVLNLKRIVILPSVMIKISMHLSALQFLVLVFHSSSKSSFDCFRLIST